MELHRETEHTIEWLLKQKGQLLHSLRFLSLLAFRPHEELGGC